MPDRFVMTASAIVMLAGGLSAQSEDAPLQIETHWSAARDWSWQCDPIRCALRVANAGPAVQVRAKHSNVRSALFPFEVEHDHEGRWQPLQKVETKRRWHPARHITSPSGQLIEHDGSFTFEVELWDLAVVSRPGRIRFRFALEARDPAIKGTVWVERPTPWLVIQIRRHPPNAAGLLAEDSAALRTQCDGMMNLLNTTQQTARNRGPFNPGPAGPRGTRANRWLPYAPTAERLLADAGISKHLQSRARLVMAYCAIEKAMWLGDEKAETPLSSARAHLAAVVFDAQPVSGGLEPLRRMLAAYLAEREGEHGSDGARDRIRKEYPYFASLWRRELRELLNY